MLALLFLPINALAEQVLIEFGKGFNLAAVAATDAKVAIDGPALRIETGSKADWPGIAFKASEGHWDLSAFQLVAFDVKNLDATAVEVCCRVDNPDADGTKNCATATVALPPNGQDTLRVFLARRLPEGVREKLFGMRGLPGGMASETIDPANIVQVLVFVSKPNRPHHFSIGNVRAERGTIEKLPQSAKDFFPLVDAFGQYMHKDWPNKITSVDDFQAHKKAETDDLAAHPGPDDWDLYGGWKTGPRLKATGFFYTTKRDGKWWLVDPEGRLFWSHGINSVRPGNAVTPITDRKHWFADLPKHDSPFAQFFGRGDWAPVGYYQGKPYETYNFGSANLLRKYGPTWQQDFRELAHRRLRSWGLNTIGNWSDQTVCLQHKTPYTATVGISSRQLEGSEGFWGKFVDVFAPEFAEAAHRAVAQHKNASAGDPWCIGYFVDNELSWGDELSLAVAALRSPANQPAKIEFVADLNKTYQSIEKLNAAWATQYASWDALLQSTATPDKAKAQRDLLAFAAKTADRYFQVCRDAVKEVAPHQLYLGCRFAWGNQIATRAAAKYCDVVSFNRYVRTVADRRLPFGLDKPVIIGEFHFGALDRGMFHTGLVFTANQNERADAYKTYVRSALDNPAIIGTHWFEFSDEATTGRGDGENYQIGFLDVCDTPYSETVQACREVARDLYQRRNGR